MTTAAFLAAVAVAVAAYGAAGHFAAAHDWGPTLLLLAIAAAALALAGVIYLAAKEVAA